MTPAFPDSPPSGESDPLNIEALEKLEGADEFFKLLNKVKEEAEKNGIWTLQSSIFQVNKASVKLHKKCGFREVGYREKIAKDRNNVWQNTVLMEYRSRTIY